MKTEIKVPAMGESISEATIGAILKPAGSLVAADDEIIELETDKVNQILYAPAAGIISWNVKSEDVVKIGQVLGVVDSAKEASSTSSPPQAKEKDKTAEPAAKQALEKPASLPQTQKLAPPPPPKIPAAATPASKESTSSEARFAKESFLEELSSPKTTATPPPALQRGVDSKAPESCRGPKEVQQRETRQKMSKIRKVIARRLVEAQAQTAMLTTFNEVDMSAIMALRELYKDSFVKQHHTKLGFMSFFIKASVAALKAFPEVNAYIEGDEIVYRNYFDIGVAVGTEKGLFVPVVRSCDTLSFAGIESSIENFAKKAREGSLVADDLQGGGFTITNGGVYGSLLSTPILNPPQSAILGMHKIEKRPVVVNDQIVIRPMMYLALSYDHRMIDGKEAVSFLVQIKQNLEDPSRLLLGL